MFLVTFDLDLGMEYTIKNDTEELIKLELVELETKLNLLSFVRYRLSIDYGEIRQQLKKNVKNIKMDLMGKIVISTLVDSYDIRYTNEYISKKTLYDDKWINYDWLDNLGIDCTKYDVKNIEIFYYEAEEQDEYISLQFTPQDWTYSEKQKEELKSIEERIEKAKKKINGEPIDEETEEPSLDDVKNVEYIDMLKDSLDGANISINDDKSIITVKTDKMKYHIVIDVEELEIYY